MSKRTRRTDHNIPLATFLRRHSPLKPSASLAVDDPQVVTQKVNKITDHIYLGNYLAAKDKQFFKDKKIKAVLNCTKDRDVPNSFASNKDIEYMRIPVDDSLREKDFDLMYQYMPCIVEFINKHVNIQKHNILVHCVAGQQRSAISVAAFLVSKCGMTPQQACKTVMDKRNQAFWFGTSLNFDKSLMKYYRDLKKNK
jgi:protein-tyrosine phosphatase